MISNIFLPVRQSAYRQYHSTEIAVTIIHNDIVRAIDSFEWFQSCHTEPTHIFPTVNG